MMFVKFTGDNHMSSVGFVRSGSVVTVPRVTGEVLLRDPEWVECTSEGEVIESMTIVDMRAYADKFGIDIPHGLGRKELIKDFLFGDGEIVAEFLKSKQQEQEEEQEKEEKEEGKEVSKKEK